MVLVLVCAVPGRPKHGIDPLRPGFRMRDLDGQPW